MTNPLEGRVFLVTGGARGQGEAEVRLLAARGASVIVGDVLEAEGLALARELGGRVIFHPQDVTREADWGAVLEVASRLGRLDGLVNNAGVYRPRSLAETEAADFEQQWRVNQLGTFLGMKLTIPLLERTGGGSIVNVSSLAGLKGLPNSVAYGGTKWALRGMTKTVAVEVAPRNIRVNSIHPGLIDTEMLAFRDPEDLRRRATQIPLRRMGTSDDVARLVLFLLSDESSYITGAEIAIDGGLSL
ncbi:SDR family NAD(P)-dependent oxidoreductase [Roseomonas chloroacetimidivorans]|uniref:SDR family NAD(P)-dependent oxidoreductase n=1 Tax=Roseomonas chloroacetimidivorans TaxID=1766656 RepID=UPI003C78D862